MKFVASLLSAAAKIGLLALVAAPTVSLAGPQAPPDEATGGLARTEVALGDLGRQTDMPDMSQRQEAIRAYNLGLE